MILNASQTLFKLIKKYCEEYNLRKNLIESNFKLYLSCKRFSFFYRFPNGITCGETELKLRLKGYRSGFCRFLRQLDFTGGISDLNEALTDFELG